LRFRCVSRSRLSSSRLPVVAAAFGLFAVVVLGTAGCSGQTQTAVPSSVPATSSAQPSPAPAPSTTSPAVASAPHLARSVPVRLQVASIGVDTTLMDLGLRKDGSMQVPPSGFPAGWYTGAPTPGELGPAIIAGHIDWNGPGVFFHLRNLVPGDKITVTRADGSKPVFRVQRVSQFPKTQFPTKLVYGNIDHAGLRLITCGGIFRSGSYEDNIVVFADLVAPPR
jgi:hypothetical protein